MRRASYQRRFYAWTAAILACLSAPITLWVLQGHSEANVAAALQSLAGLSAILFLIITETNQPPTMPRWMSASIIIVGSLWLTASNNNWMPLLEDRALPQLTLFSLVITFAARGSSSAERPRAYSPSPWAICMILWYPGLWLMRNGGTTIGSMTLLHGIEFASHVLTFVPFFFTRTMLVAVPWAVLCAIAITRWVSLI